MAFGKIAVGDIERVGLGDLGGVDEDTAVLFGLADREIGIPDRPGIDAEVGEGRARIRRRQIYWSDIGIGEIGFFESLNDDIMGAGTLGESDALALQIRDAADRGIAGNEDALPVGNRLARGI